MLAYISAGVFFLIIIVLIIYKLSTVNLNDIERVYDVNLYDDYQKIIVKKGLKKIILYDSSVVDIHPGYKISFVFKEKEALKERIEGGFNYYKYLEKSNYLPFTYNIEKVSIIKKGFNLNSIKYYINCYVNKKFSGNTKAFIKGLILSNKNDFEEEFLKSIKDNGIMHLFAISGLHVNLLIGILNKMLSKTKINSDIFISIFLFLYIIITSFSSSVIRAVLMYYLALLNKKLKLDLSGSDVISIVFLFLIILNPNYMYNLGFVLSFLVSLLIILLSPLIKDKKNIYQTFLITLLSNIISLPIIINMNNEYNILSIFTSIIFICLVSYLILPMTFLAIFTPFISFLYENIYNMFINLSNFISKYLSIIVSIKEMNGFLIMIYYLLILLILRCFKKIKTRKILIGMMGILIIFIFASFNHDKEIVFMDLDDGDATLILAKEGNVLIDTGSGKNNEVLNFLKRKGVKELDILFITHNHDDHNGEASSIISNIKVDKVVTNYYDNTFYDCDVFKAKSGDKINLNGLVFYILNPYSYNSDENDNGLVIYVNIDDTNMLFLADVSEKIENEICNMNIAVDLIKVAHHGSNTSTSIKMLSKFKPKYAIIETGRVSGYGFPSKKTINNLESLKIKIYRTDSDYSIIYKRRKFYTLNNSWKKPLLTK